MRKLPQIIDREEFERLVKATQLKINKKGVAILRKKHLQEYLLAMILGFEAGMRISEIIGWKRIPKLTKDRFEVKYIKILGKGRKERVVPRPKRATTQVLGLLPITVSRRAVQHYITNLGEEVLQKHISFHTLRHGFGSHLAGKGLPLHEIMMLMGHARLDTTGIYLHANPQETLKKVEALF